jgi:hypothetical protein
MEKSSRSRGFQRACYSEADQGWQVALLLRRVGVMGFIHRSFYDKVLDTDETVVLSDGHLIKFWSLLLKFTEAADLASTRTRDGLLNALANFSFHVTAQHEQVGSISDSMETPLHGGLRLMPGKLRVDKQSFVIGLVLLGSTSLRTPPLLSDLKFI